ncbi:MAG: hypothetical protein M3527_04510 [Actinomycetota bacterium]|nr:hypothetical protein [Actinomycetota bacterium]
MPDEKNPQSTRIGGDAKQGPDPDPGGQLDVEENAPPYDGRTTGSDGNDERAASVERQMADTQEQHPGQVTTPVEESPVQESELTDEEPATPHGSGESTTRRGENIQGDDGKEPGRHDGPPSGGADRPTGTSDARDMTGVGE